MTFVPVTAHTLMSHGGNDKHDPSMQTYVADTLTSGSHPGSNMPGRRREDDTNIVARTIKGFGERGWSNSAESIDLTTLDRGAVRRLTPRECERLQGFPDDWTALGPDSRRYAALGDAVTVSVSEWIGRRVLARGA